jgi:hypothetical protein
MKLNQSKNQRLKKSLNGLPRKMVSAPLLSFVFFSILFLLIGVIVFYQNVIVVERSEIQSSHSIISFDNDIYEDILNIWTERENRFQSADSKEYMDIFRVRID